MSTDQPASDFAWSNEIAQQNLFSNEIVLRAIQDPGKTSDSEALFLPFIILLINVGSIQCIVQLTHFKLQVCEFVCAGVTDQYYEAHTLDIIIFVHNYCC